MRPKRILLVSYLFPPAGGVGVARAIAYTRYLPTFGCEVWVLAARNPSTPLMDPALAAQIPPSAHVERVLTPELPFHLRDKLWKRIAGKPKTAGEAAADGRSPGRSALGGVARLIRKLTSPDPQVVWTPWATRRAAALVRRHQIDTVLVTVPPFSALAIGVELKRLFPHLKVISDFRDEWLNFYLNLDPATRAPLRADAERRERAAVEASSLVVANTPVQAVEMRGRYPDQPAEKFIAIPNGYDPALFADFRPRPHGGGKIVVSFFGTVYRYNTPRTFLQAVDLLEPSLASRIETRFFGRITDDQQPLLVSRQGSVRIFGFVPYAEALRRMEETDYLLLPVDSATAHAGKLFEYLATGKPILAPTPPNGAIAQVLAETGAGWAADPKDLNSVAAMIRQAIETVEAGRFHPNHETVEAYTRPRLIGELIRAAESAA